VSPDAVRTQLQRILVSPQLVDAPGLAALLGFIVEETLGGRGDDLKERRMGTDVFHRRPATYDPAIDPIVRVQVGRLRAKLRAYYDGSGARDDVSISIPRGRYAAVFALRAAGAPATVHPETRAAAPSELRLAVLPFVNMSANPANEFFSDGLTEELINVLARDHRIQVVARTSSFQFKGQARDIRGIGRQLEVGKILEGSVRQSGTCVRVTAQLINVADGCHVWSDRYTGEATDIFSIHEQIAEAIHGALHPHLVPRANTRPRHRGAHDIDAYNHYLQGRFLWNRRTEQGLRAAIEHFTLAVKLDPGFARALSGLADCHLMLGMSAAEAPERSMRAATTAARKALAQDTGIAETHASLAAVSDCYEWNRAAAEASYRQALALDPSYATAHHWHALFHLASAGRLAEATEELEIAIELDPLATPIIADLALVHCFAGDHDAAADQCYRAMELDPNFHRPYWFLGLSRACVGDFDAAVAALVRGLELCPGHAFRSRLLGALGFCRARAGQRTQADDVLHELVAQGATRYVSRFDIAQVQAGHGDIDAALEQLQEAVEARESFAVFLPVWPSFVDLRDHPRFLALLSVIGSRG
jgi:TolB-like protein/Tfp pilus assembly protein PilF